MTARPEARPRRDPGAATTAARLVHLGDRFAVLDKPAGLSLATRRSEPGAAAARLVAALPEGQRAMLEGREVELVHRLDAPTSGLTLVALDAEMHRQLLSAFSQRRVSKLYLALVWGRPRPAAGRFEQALGPDRADRRRMRIDPRGKRALTQWQIVAVAPHVALLGLWPLTGRTHQIRVHLAAAGHPILGDDLYGGPRERGVRDHRLRRALAVGRTMLHAWRLEVPELEPSRFEAPPPRDFASACAAAGLDLARGRDLWQAPDISTR